MSYQPQSSSATPRRTTFPPASPYNLATPVANNPTVLLSPTPPANPNPNMQTPRSSTAPLKSPRSARSPGPAYLSSTSTQPQFSPVQMGPSFDFQRASPFFTPSLPSRLPPPSPSVSHPKEDRFEPESTFILSGYVRTQGGGFSKSERFQGATVARQLGCAEGMDSPGPLANYQIPSIFKSDPHSTLGILYNNPLSVKIKSSKIRFKPKRPKTSQSNSGFNPLGESKENTTPVEQPPAALAAALSKTKPENSFERGKHYSDQHRHQILQQLHANQTKAGGGIDLKALDSDGDPLAPFKSTFRARSRSPKSSLTSPPTTDRTINGLVLHGLMHKIENNLAVSPQNYNVKHHYLSNIQRSPASSFGSDARFQSERPKSHNLNFVEPRVSPGPKYVPNRSNFEYRMKSPPSWSFGGKGDVSDRSYFVFGKLAEETGHYYQARPATCDSVAGVNLSPCQYNPTLDYVKHAAPRPAWPKSDRFAQSNQFLSKKHVTDKVGTNSPGPMYAPDYYDIAKPMKLAKLRAAMARQKQSEMCGGRSIFSLKQKQRHYDSFVQDTQPDFQQSVHPNNDMFLPQFQSHAQPSSLQSAPTPAKAEPQFVELTEPSPVHQHVEPARPRTLHHNTRNYNHVFDDTEERFD